MLRGMTSSDPATDRSPASDRSADDARWADAASLLSDQATRSAQRRLRRSSRVRLLVVVGLLVGLGALGAAVGLLVTGDRNGSSPADVPTWQVVVGLALMAVGTLVAGVAVVRQICGLRRRRGWRSPLLVLTPQQRKGLLAQVRGKAPVHPDRVALAREVAHGLLQQRAGLGIHLGLTVMWTGQAVFQPSWWRVFAASAFAVLYALTGVLLERDARRVREFLAAHPE